MRRTDSQSEVKATASRDAIVTALRLASRSDLERKKQSIRFVIPAIMPRSNLLHPAHSVVTQWRG